MKNNMSLRWAVSLAAAFVTSVACLAAPAESPTPESPGTNAKSAATPSAADNASKPSKRQTYPFRGVIGTFDSETRLLTLEGKQGKRVIRITDTTRLERQGRPGTADDLKRGEKVGGTLKRNPQGEEEALLVRVAPKPGSEPDTEAEDPSSGPPKKEAAE